jgi:hypothetical protein
MRKKTFTRIVIMLLLLALSPAARAAKTSQYLQITEKNSSEVVNFKLAQKPVITITNNQLVITDTTATITIAIANVDNYKFVDLEDTPTAIKSIVGTSEAEKPSFANGKAFFSGLEPGSFVSIYTIDGKLTGQTVATSDGTAVVDYSNSAERVMILRTNSASYKIINNK